MNTKAGKTRRIGKFHFRLTGRESLYFKGEHVVSFAPLPKNKLVRNRSILPTFNHDRKYYTYAFQLPASPTQNDEELLEEHQKRAAEALIEPSDLFMPKPRSRHKYCGVCRGHYEDYKEHIEAEPHLGNLKRSQYQALIVHFCEKFQASAWKKEPEEAKIVDLTCEEPGFRMPGELVETTSGSKTNVT